MSEILLGVQPFVQPSPARNPGGDCFACAMTAALRHLFPENPPSFDQAFNFFVNDKGQLSNSWGGMRSALWSAYSDGYPIEIRADMVTPSFDPEHFSYPWWSWWPTGEYAHRLEGWFRAGWIAFTEIDYAGRGPMNGEGQLHGTDHFILLDGIRMVWEPLPDSVGVAGRSMVEYVHVVCSAKGAYWTPLQKFLRLHGASAWWLARRDER